MGIGNAHRRSRRKCNSLRIRSKMTRQSFRPLALNKPRRLIKRTILPGDGIGPKVTEQAVLVLQAVADVFGHQLQLLHKNIGGAALAAVNDPLPPETIKACLASSAVLM